MHTFGKAPHLKPHAVLTREDEDLAGRLNVNLLITSGAGRGVEKLARRIHGTGARARFPFVRTPAADLSTDPPMLRRTCSGLLDAAAGGTLLISDVEEMPHAVQELLVETLIDLAGARSPSAGVRLIAGTTVSLVDRVADGRFSERLFYRLNMFHLRAIRRGTAIKPADRAGGDRGFA